MAMLEISDLRFAIGGAAIIDDVSLEVAAGELLAVIGPNGAGKTTLFNLISGVSRPTAGTIRFAGRDITRQPPYRRARAGLGRSFQTSSVFPELSVRENVRLAAEAHLGGTLRIWRRASAVRAAVEMADESIEQVGLSARADRRAGELSHGDKRKVELAIIVASDPKAILLDEPMAGVSMEDVPELTELIGRLHTDLGKTVLMVEHHMHVVLGLADRVAVMHHGRLLAVDAPDAVMADAAVQSAYLGDPL